MTPIYFHFICSIDVPSKKYIDEFQTKKKKSRLIADSDLCRDMFSTKCCLFVQLFRVVLYLNVIFFSFFFVSFFVTSPLSGYQRDAGNNQRPNYSAHFD